MKRNMETLEELNKRKEAAFAKIDREYYDRQSPHYKDNERFSWAVEAINRIHNQDVENLKQLESLNP